jgi:hypothetical protein
MLNFLTLFTSYFLFFILFSLPIAIFVNRFVKENVLFSFAASLGLSLPLSALILNYLFVFFPNFTVSFYLGIIFSFFFLLSIIQRNHIINFINSLIIEFKLLFGKYSMLCFILLLLLVSCQVSYAILKPFTEHDSFEYAIQGRIFAKELSIKYLKNRIDANSGFYYVGLHGFIYPLIYSLENLYTSYFLKPSDFLFRGLNTFYSFFLLLLIGTYYKKKSIKLALIAVLTIIFYYSFIFTALQTSLDHLRIYLMLVFLFLWRENSNETKSKFVSLLFIILGLSANIHSLNMIIGCFLLFSWSVYQLINNKPIYLLFVASLAYFIGGSFHYLLDTFIGTGWIFNL